MSAVSPRVLSIEDTHVSIPMPRAALTHAGFRAWVMSNTFPDHVRATFVRGEVLLDMSPEAIESHNKAKNEITSVLTQIVRDEDLGEIYADRVLYTHAKAGISTEPDMFFASWDALESKRVDFVRRARGDDFIEVVGSPDLIVEVVSDSSVRKDLTLLKDGYLRARVREYWVVDARREDLRFEIFRLQGKQYTSSRSGRAQRSAVLDRSFLLERKQNRVGRWSYRLSVA
jgi:Uma2 family endonuclease